jgi:tetratricopeptide (TPR) repeat protein
LHYRAGRYREALPLLQKARDKAPAPDEVAATRLWLGLTLHRLGQTEKAKEEFAQAEKWLKKFPDGLSRDAQRRFRLHLHTWLEVHVMRPEVETLLRPAAGKGK